MPALRSLPPNFLDRSAAQAKQVAGRPSLDRANAAGGWNSRSVASGKAGFEPREDRFHDYEDLIASGSVKTS